MKTRIALSLAFLCLASCKVIQGSGTSKTEKRDVGEFTSVEASDGLEVDVEPGARAVAVTGDDNIVPKVKTDVSSGKLHVSIDGSVAMKIPVVVHVSAPGIKECDAESGSTLKARVDGDNVTLIAKSGAKLTANGAVNKLDLEASSGANLDASALKADTVEAKVSSGSDASTAVTHAVSGSATSGAHLHVFGGPSKKDVSQESGGSVSYDAGDAH